MKKIIFACVIIILISGICLVSCDNSSNTPTTSGTDNNLNNDVEYSQGLEFRYIEYWEVVDGPTYVLSGIGECKDKVVYVPNEYNGVPVFAIDDFGLSRCDFIEEVVLPDSIMYISDRVFERCTSLTTITIPNTVIGIAPEGLARCPALINIIFKGTIDEWLSIEKYSGWDYLTGEYTVYCNDGEIAKDGTITRK